MRKLLFTFAALISLTAIILALDLGRFAFQYIDVGGHSLRMLIRGHGSPAVVFENGGLAASGATLEDWFLVQPAVSQFATTVAYDRAGVGLSDPGPQPRDGRAIARELHNALHNARIAPPYILVGHSFGGPFIRIFAGMYPNETAGLVLVDPTQEEFINRDPSPAVNQGDFNTTQWEEIQTTLAEAHDSPVPKGIPVILITGMGPRNTSYFREEEKNRRKRFMPLWLNAHSAWLAKIPNSQHIVTDISAHGIQYTEPELVITAIRQEFTQSANPHPQ